jgi:hypothetical protein
MEHAINSNLHFTNGAPAAKLITNKSDSPAQMKSSIKDILIANPLIE